MNIVYFEDARKSNFTAKRLNTFVPHCIQDERLDERDSSHQETISNHNLLARYILVRKLRRNQPSNTLSIRRRNSSAGTILFTSS